jgi:hypothetical protein
MSTQYDLQSDMLLIACRLAAVAAVANVNPSDWASTISPRVQVGNSLGYVQGLHRGRLPFIELFQSPQTWESQTATGGTTETVWNIRCHVPGPTHAAAQSKAQEIIQVCLAAIRSLDYFFQGGQAFTELQESPLGFSLSCSMVFSQTFCKSDFGTGIVVTPGSPVVVVPGVGGTTFLFSFNEVTPSIVFMLPAGQSLDNVEIQILDAWDGVGASIAIGVIGSPNLFFAPGVIEPDLAGATFEVDEDLAGPQTVIATWVPGAGATSGTARIQLTVTETGT